MSPIGDLIWISTKPFLKLFLTTFCGYYLAKAGLLKPAAAQGAGKVLLHVFLPALLFSKIVPCFTVENIDTLVPLVLVACIYHLYGFVVGWIARKLFWVPSQFQYGILAAGMWSNWGELPNAVVIAMTSYAPFQSSDSDRAVAYISVFILVMSVTMFPLGGHRIIAKDFTDVFSPGENDDVPQAGPIQFSRRLYQLYLVIQRLGDTKEKPDVEQVLPKEQPTRGNDKSDPTAAPLPLLPHRVDSDPENDARSMRSPTPSPGSPAPTLVEIPLSPAQGDLQKSPRPDRRFHSTRSYIKKTSMTVQVFLISLATPVTITITISFVIALVPALRALFIPSPAGSKPLIGLAPDGLPPLNVLFDTATSIGNACTPLALVCLGSAMAELQVPQLTRSIPFGAITTFTILKMVVGPVFGVIIVEALTHHTSLIDPNDKVLRLVCMFLSGVPSATVQVYLTQVYSPDGSAQHIAAFLIPQYVLMLPTMITLCAYALSVLF